MQEVRGGAVADLGLQGLLTTLRFLTALRHNYEKQWLYSHLSW